MNRLLLLACGLSLLLTLETPAIEAPQVQISAEMNPPDFVNVTLSWDPVPEACGYAVYLRSPHSGLDSMLYRTASTQIAFSLPTGWTWFQSPDLVRTMFVTAEDELFGFPSGGMLAWYPLAGNATNAVSDSLHGVVNGAVSVADRFGQEGQALQFDGVNDFVGFPTSIRPPTITVSLWFRALGQARDMTLMRNRPHSYNLGVQYYENADRLLVGCYVSNGAQLYRYDSPPGLGLDGSWHHLAMTYGGDQFVVYFDGLPVYMDDQFGSNNPIYYGGFGTAIGRDGNLSARWLDGAVDDVVVYDRALTQEEIRIVYDRLP
jgi:hypothetical protein